MEKVFVAKRVASKLHGTEVAIDAAMVQAAELMADMVQGRKDLKLSATVGSAATAKVMAALAALSDARTAMVEAHGEMEQTALRLGVRTKMFGFDSKEGSLQAPEVTEERFSEAS
ncbi:hypothetical protein [Caulobacter sp. DWR2-3-1b2]|uniref:hypothetical protein n=1 Tax=unclassified Caulobacter TaxID=2648921 RepID=UPI003CF57EA6